MQARADRQFRPALEGLTDRCLPAPLGAGHVAAHHHARHVAHHLTHRQAFERAKWIRVFLFSPRINSFAPVLPQLPSGPNQSPPVIFHPTM